MEVLVPIDFEIVGALLTQGFQARKRAVLALADQPLVADHVSGHNGVPSLSSPSGSLAVVDGGCLAFW
jgi:hypothetical protein